MQVQFKTNLGSVHAEKIGVDHKQCTCDAVLEVSDDVGAKLCELGVAVALPEKKTAAKPSPVPAPIPDSKQK